MSKTTKNVLIVITFICVIVLVAFAIELLRLNRGKENPAGSGSSISVTSPAADAAKTADPTPSGNGSAQEDSEDEPVQLPLRRTGRRYELLYSETKMLVLYADEELFELTETYEGYMFSYTKEGNASLEICLTYIPNGAEKGAESYLNGYLEGNDSFVSGLGPIRRSALSGVFVSGVKDGETFEAWIHDISDDHSDMGVAFVIRYKNNEQKNALYGVLDSLELIET